MESRQRGLSGQSSCNAHVKGTSECSSNELCCEKLNEEDDVGKQINDATEYYASTNASAGPWTVSRSANPLDDFEVLETLFQSQLSPTQVHLVEDRKSHEVSIISVYNTSFVYFKIVAQLAPYFILPIYFLLITKRFVHFL